MKHIHADLMLLYAQDAQESECPWKNWERWSNFDKRWVNLGWHPSWDLTKQYRQKPCTHVVNGFIVPVPVKIAPEVGEKYWIAEPTSAEFFWKGTWLSDATDIRCLERGLVHASKDAAVANAKAMLSIQP